MHVEFILYIFCNVSICFSVSPRTSYIKNLNFVFLIFFFFNEKKTSTLFPMLELSQVRDGEQVWVY